MKRKILIAVLLLTGAILLLSPFIKEGLIARLSSQYNQEHFTSNQLAANNKRQASFKFQSIQPPGLLETVQSGLVVNPKAVIGQLRVPSVGINLPILKGTTSANLLGGATTMRPDQKMGTGNYPLAGHHMREGNLLFGPLMRIRIGARIVITNLKKHYTYQVTERNIVAETDGAVIDQTKTAQVTLVTCDKPTRTPNRLIVVGKLIKETIHQKK
ncbi:class A sortase [Sporolactobacillus spathodeae]|uniref:Sortase A n=1 Tax=Sporolactobacillus spathodeae TaxID=1465502 RepID=A0ABS2Q548_9BACL|nr:class A sortase [Sporolactobacillus spathodeae]MBM7656913.1 sortase A [Sporolactobacillus spathodeae]